MDDRDSLAAATAARLPAWLWPLLVLSALGFGYGAAERLYEFSQTGGAMRGLSSVGFAMMAVFNIAVALRLIRRRSR